LFFNKNNGAYNGIILNNLKEYSATDLYYQYKNLLVVGFGYKHNQILDLEAKKIVNTYSNPSLPIFYNSNDISGFNNSYFRTGIQYSNENDTLFKHNYIIQHDLNNNLLDTIFDLKENSCLFLKLSPLTFFINNNNDIITVFKRIKTPYDLDCSAKFSSGAVDLISFNITKRKIEWMKEDFIEYNQSSSNFPIPIENGKLIIFENNIVYQIDVNTGNIVWQSIIPNVFFTNSVLKNNVLILESYNKNLVALDINNGSLLWKYNGEGLYSENYQIFKDVIYFVNFNDYLYEIKGINLKTGKLVWRYKFKDEKISIGITNNTIDEETGLLYTASYEKIICIKLPDF
jgi:hypothetical protein